MVDRLYISPLPQTPATPPPQATPAPLISPRFGSGGGSVRIVRAGDGRPSCATYHASIAQS